MPRLNSEYTGHTIQAKEKGVARKIEGKLKGWARANGVATKVIESHGLGGKVLFVQGTVPTEVIQKAVQPYSRGVRVNYAA